MPHMIEISALSKIYPSPRGGAPLTVFENLHFTLEKGDFVCLIGHSGCGKTTILNALAGLETPSAGTLVVGGKEVTGPGLDRGVVFQGYALMPWMSVLENITFAVSARWRAWNRAKIREHAMRYIELVGLGQAADKKPCELSGGMRQRVGIARALAIEPQVLLMDEPFGALDALTRGVIQDEMHRLARETHQTVFMITHDVDEAILLSNKIMLMTNGPYAKLAEIVENTLPENRTRNDVHKHPHYYNIRNHIVDFLVSRSKNFDFELSAGRIFDPRHPTIVRPGPGDFVTRAALPA